MNILLIAIGSLIVLAIIAAVIYNRYVKLKNLNEEGFHEIGICLQKRLDLIPGLINVVKGYAETLENVIKLRSQMEIIDKKNIDNIEKIKKIENETEKTLKSIMILQENYPDLKANENFLKLQTQLMQIETEIQRSRRYYNGTARDRNTFVETFPNNFIGKILGFKKSKFLEITDKAEKTPEIKF
ncbi:LemA family protein [uncultured Leptotrichia sp.]|uniref:LemA family protein n=1 Tax=uncultured Leptotrichia sp. TaxID=159271 RepID=UPI001A516ACD|nr:LemA family protein [uncultured Leptotrichia sp.]VTX60856.1 LemA family protein [uncultured Leptotrichia sp.]